MLVKITNKCRMGCRHCMDDCKPDDDQFMSLEVLAQAIDFIDRNGFRVIMISGGEPLEHSQFFEMAEMVKKSKLIAVILSNGMFVEDPKLRDQVLRLGLTFQITNDPQYYPKSVVEYKHPLFVYEHKLRIMIELGRAQANGIKGTRNSPMCFNLRSATRHLRDFKQAVMTLRTKGKMCTPYVEIDGSLIAGESKFCYKIGDLNSTNAEITKNLINMKCNYCQLQDRLSAEARTAIGI